MATAGPSPSTSTPAARASAATASGSTSAIGRLIRRSGAPAVAAALIMVVVTSFVILVVEGAHIASSMRFGTAGSTITVVTGPGGDTDNLFTDASSFTDSQGLGLAYTAPGAPTIVTIHDPGGIFGDRRGSFNGRLAGAPAGAVLLSSAIPGSEDHPPTYPASVLPDGHDATVVGVFDPQVQLGGFYPAVIRHDWGSAHTDSVSDGTFTFGSSAGQKVSREAVEGFFAGKHIPIVSLAAAGPKSGATFATSARGKLSVVAALLLILAGWAMAYTTLSARNVPLRIAVTRYVRAVILGTLAGMVLMFAVEAFILSPLLIVGWLSTWMATAGAALACALVWVALTALASLVVGARRRRAARGKSSGAGGARRAAGHTA